MPYKRAKIKEKYVPKAGAYGTSEKGFQRSKESLDRDRRVNCKNNNFFKP